jgi:hypothetical protein
MRTCRGVVLIAFVALASRLVEAQRPKIAPSGVDHRVGRLTQSGPRTPLPTAAATAPCQCRCYAASPDDKTQLLLVSMT